MATRSLVTRIWTPAASALRCCPGAGMPAAARHRFLHAIPSQNGAATRRYSFDVESARDLLEKAKKQEAVMRRGIKWMSRGVKTVEWACYFCVSATIATAAAVMANEE